MKTSKTIKAAKFGYIVTSLVSCAAGIFLIVCPGISAQALCYAAGALLILCGVIKLIGYFSKDLYRLAFQFDLALGLLSVAMGLVMLFHPAGVISILHIVIGILALADSLFKIQTAVDAKRFGIRKWWVIGLTAVVTGLFGLLLVIDPFTGASLLMVMVGITLLAEGILNLCVALCAVKIIKGKKPDIVIIEE